MATASSVAQVFERLDAFAESHGDEGALIYQSHRRLPRLAPELDARFQAHEVFVRDLGDIAIRRAAVGVILDGSVQTELPDAGNPWVNAQIKHI